MLKTGRTARGRRRRERCGDHDIVWGRMVGGGSVASECVGNSLNRARGVIGRFRPKVARCAPSDTALRLRARNPRAERAERKALSARARARSTRDPIGHPGRRGCASGAGGGKNNMKSSLFRSHTHAHTARTHHTHAHTWLCLYTRRWSPTRRRRPPLTHSNFYTRDPCPATIVRATVYVTANTPCRRGRAANSPRAAAGSLRSRRRAARRRGRHRTAPRAAARSAASRARLPPPA